MLADALQACDEAEVGRSCRCAEALCVDPEERGLDRAVVIDDADAVCGERVGQLLDAPRTNVGVDGVDAFELGRALDDDLYAGLDYLGDAGIGRADDEALREEGYPAVQALPVLQREGDRGRDRLRGEGAEHLRDAVRGVPARIATLRRLAVEVVADHALGGLHDVGEAREIVEQPERGHIEEDGDLEVGLDQDRALAVGFGRAVAHPEHGPPDLGQARALLPVGAAPDHHRAHVREPVGDDRADEHEGRLLVASRDRQRRAEVLVLEVRNRLDRVLDVEPVVRLEPTHGRVDRAPRTRERRAVAALVEEPAVALPRHRRLTALKPRGGVELGPRALMLHGARELGHALLERELEVRRRRLRGVQALVAALDHLQRVADREQEGDHVPAEDVQRVRGGFGSTRRAGAVDQQRREALQVRAVGGPVAVEADRVLLDVAHDVEEVELHDERAALKLHVRLVGHLLHDLAGRRRVACEALEAGRHLQPLLQDPLLERGLKRDGLARGQVAHEHDAGLYERHDRRLEVVVAVQEPALLEALPAEAAADLPHEGEEAAARLFDLTDEALARGLVGELRFERFVGRLGVGVRRPLDPWHARDAINAAQRLRGRAHVTSSSSLTVRKGSPTRRGNWPCSRSRSSTRGACDAGNTKWRSPSATTSIARSSIR